MTKYPCNFCLQTFTRKETARKCRYSCQQKDFNGLKTTKDRVSSLIGTQELVEFLKPNVLSLLFSCQKAHETRVISQLEANFGVQRRRKKYLMSTVGHKRIVGKQKVSDLHFSMQTNSSRNQITFKTCLRPHLKIALKTTNESHEDIQREPESENDSRIVSI
jgi:hypothetical protein